MPSGEPVRAASMLSRRQRIHRPPQRRRALSLPLPRWLLSLVVLCGMLLAPAAMATSCAPPPSVDHAASHCAEDGADGHMPAKQFHCVCACPMVKMGIARFPAPSVSRLAAIPIPAASSLSGILLERDTPPPRLA